MLLPQVRELLPTSPGLDLSTPGLVLSTPGLVRNSRRLVKNTSRGPGKRNNHAEKMLGSVWWRPFYARVYTYFISLKMYSPIHMMPVSFWYSVDSSVKVLISKCSPGQQSIHTGGERLWRVESVNFHTGKPPENQQIHAVKTPQWRWILENPNLHTRNRCKSDRNALCVKEWTLFLRKNCV